MKFASIRDFRINASALLKRAGPDEAIVVTLRGKPVALFVPVGEDRIEEVMQAINAARLRATVEKLRAQSAKTGTSKLSAAAIDRELRAVRRARRA